MNRGVKLFFLVLILVNTLCLLSATLRVDSAILKTSLKEGNIGSSFFTLNSDKPSSVELELINLAGVSLDSSSFFIEKGDSKKVLLNIDSQYLSPGIYLGKVKINSGSHSFFLPVLIELESRDVFFDGNLEIPSSSLLTSPGKVLNYQLDLFDLTFGTDGLGSSSIELETEIYSFEGEKMYSQAQTLVVDKTLKIASSINLPSELKYGEYLLSVKIKYKNSIGISSKFFEVSSPLKVSSAAFGNSEIFWIVLGVVALFLIAVVFFIYMIKDRNKLFLELREYNWKEMQEQKKFLLEQERLLQRQNVSRKEIKEQINEKVKELKKKQEKRIVEFKKIKKCKNPEKEMKKRLEQWKNKGYNTLLLESKLKGINSESMKRMMQKWKMQGYK